MHDLKIEKSSLLIASRCIVASGQMGRNPRIYVWRIPLYRGDFDFSNQVLAKLSLGRKRRQVSALSFNGTGKFLCALSEDLDHSIFVFDWRKEEVVREAKGHGGLVDCLLFNPYGDRAFASCGEKHLKFWEMGCFRLLVQSFDFLTEMCRRC